MGIARKSIGSLCATHRFNLDQLHICGDKPENTILLGSLPRSGSTMLAEAIREHKICFHLHMLTPFACGLLYKGVKTVYTYSNPLHAVLSTEVNHIDNSPHYSNCGYFGNTNRNLFEEDFLNYELMFDSWMRLVKLGLVVGIRYECLWEHIDCISKYIGAKVTLPKYKKRAAAQRMRELAYGEMKSLRKTYGTLCRKVFRAPDCSICGI